MIQPAIIRLTLLESGDFYSEVLRRMSGHKRWTSGFSIFKKINSSIFENLGNDRG